MLVGGVRRLLMFSVFQCMPNEDSRRRNVWCVAGTPYVAAYCGADPDADRDAAGHGARWRRDRRGGRQSWPTPLPARCVGEARQSLGGVLAMHPAESQPGGHRDRTETAAAISSGRASLAICKGIPCRSRSLTRSASVRRPGAATVQARCATVRSGGGCRVPRTHQGSRPCSLAGSPGC